MVPNKGHGENIRTNNWTEKDGPEGRGTRCERTPSFRCFSLLEAVAFALDRRGSAEDRSTLSSTDDGRAVERRRKSKNTQSRIVSSGGGNFSLVACSGEQVFDRGAPPSSLDYIPYRGKRRAVAKDVLP